MSIALNLFVLKGRVQHFGKNTSTSTFGQSLTSYSLFVKSIQKQKYKSIKICVLWGLYAVLFLGCPQRLPGVSSGCIATSWRQQAYTIESWIHIQCGHWWALGAELADFLTLLLSQTSCFPFYSLCAKLSWHAASLIVIIQSWDQYWSSHLALSKTANELVSQNVKLCLSRPMHPKMKLSARVVILNMQCRGKKKTSGGDD